MAAIGLKHYRYPIPELLEISANITTPFDLSRLSFNAVRAGIVPALASCTMAIREIVVQPRNREWCQQTSSASDEQMTLHENTLEYPIRQPKKAPVNEQLNLHEYPMEHPVRQPKNAPAGSTNQKYEGFVQFLKTHSSPNNTRVTAGGRIVPMESRQAPPRFTLPPSKMHQNAGSGEKGVAELSPKAVASCMDRVTEHSNNVSSLNNVTAFGYNTTSGNNFLPSNIASGCVPQAMAPLNPQQAALDSNIMMQNQLLSYGQGLGAAPLYPGMYGMTAPTSTVTHQYPTSFQCFPYSGSLAQPSAISPSLQMGYGPPPQALPILRAKLNDANHAFEVYQQQLRDLDRYRATHLRDEVLVEQRLQIVSHRSEAKAEMRRLQEAICLHEQNHAFPPLSPQEWYAGNDQNWAVRSSPHGAKELSPSKGGAPTAKTVSKLNVAAAAYVPKTYNLASAIGNPAPGLPAENYSVTKIDNGNSGEKFTDKWNNRTGKPPPALRLNQNSLAEQLSNQLNTPKTSSDDTNDKSSGQSHKFVSSNSAPQVMVHGMPAPLAAECGRIMDAMRKPKGTLTPVLYSEGHTKLVQGIDLQPPSEEEMTSFDRAYWKLHSGSDDKENSRSPSFTAKTSTLSFEKSVLPQDQAKAYRGSLKDSPSRHALSELSATIGYNSQALPLLSRKEEWDAAIRKLEAQAASEASTAADRNRDSLLNKTLSSTAFQGVHATASLPRGLDGAVEATLLKMKANTPNTETPKSPKSPKSPRAPFFQGFRRTFTSK